MVLVAGMLLPNPSVSCTFNGKNSKFKTQQLNPHRLEAYYFGNGPIKVSMLHLILPMRIKQHQ
jgi:hypothetical protein